MRRRATFAFLLVFLLVSSHAMSVKQFEFSNKGAIGAALGFPLGYVSGQTTLTSSGDDNAGGAFVHGVAGAGFIKHQSHSKICVQMFVDLCSADEIVANLAHIWFCYILV